MDRGRPKQWLAEVMGELGGKESFGHDLASHAWQAKIVDKRLESDWRNPSGWRQDRQRDRLPCCRQQFKYLVILADTRRHKRQWLLYAHNFSHRRRHKVRE